MEVVAVFLYNRPVRVFWIHGGRGGETHEGREGGRGVGESSREYHIAIVIAKHNRPRRTIGDVTDHGRSNSGSSNIRTNAYSSSGKNTTSNNSGTNT